MVAIQLDFWETAEQSELNALRNLFEKDHKTLEKVRKSTYAKINKTDQVVADIDARLTILERNICKGLLSA